MRRRKAAPVWLLALPAMLAAGCASLTPGYDPLDHPALNADAKSPGILGESTGKFVTSAKTALGWGPDEAAARELYDEALVTYQIAAEAKDGRRAEIFLDASKQFTKAAEKWPSSSVEEDAMFHEAESLFFADRYPKAEEIFAQLIKKYPNSKYAEKISQRRFQAAKYWLDHHRLDRDYPVTPNLTARDRPVFDKFGHGIRVLERIRLDDPTGDLADDATMLAASACFTDERFYRADELLTDLRRSFPNSDHQFEAHLLGLRCKMELYQGPDYDGGPLDEAEQLIKQLRRQFPNEAREHDEFLARAWKDVRMNRAVREMNLAQYRDRRKEYRAARLHYDKVVEEFGDTSLAKVAEDRLAQLGGAPDLPPQRLQWLARVFPTGEREVPLLATSPSDSDLR